MVKEGSYNRYLRNRKIVQNTFLHTYWFVVQLRRQIFIYTTNLSSQSLHKKRNIIRRFRRHDIDTGRKSVT